MKNKKVMALILAATMVVGSSMTVFAADANGADSVGTSFEHVNKDVIDVTLPTDTAVATVFNYYVDPEGAIKSAGSLLNGTGVTGNDDGVYFVNTGAAAVNGTVTSNIAADASNDYQVTVSDLTVNETYTYVDTAAVNGTVTSNIAADSSSDYQVTVSDLTINETYTYNGSEWQDSNNATATVTIDVKQNDGSTAGTIADGDTVTVSGGSAAVQEWQDSNNATAAVTITVKQSDGSTAGTIADGDTVTVSGATAAGDAGFSSSSDAVIFEGKNSVDVDVTVAATVTATNADKDIALVADQDALDAAAGPALLMTLKVGSDTKVITSEGATAKAIISGVPGNFATKPSGDGTKFEFALKDSGLAAWNSTTVQLVGKTNAKDVPAGAGAMTVPKISLTWTITKHENYTNATAHGSWSNDGSLWLAKDASTGFSTTGLTVEVSDGGTTYKTLATDKYSINDAGWINTNWANIVAGIGSEPTGNAFVRITDGTTRYVFENK